MAGIANTYIDSRDYKEYRQWWIDNYEKMSKELEDIIYLSPLMCAYEEEIEDITPEFLATHDDDIKLVKGRYDFPIWNTSCAEDLWLIKHCKIQSFVDRMKYVYPSNWKGFKYIKNTSL